MRPHAFAVTLSTPDLAVSREFYERLGFQAAMTPSSHALHLWDGGVRLVLVEAEPGRAKLTYFVDGDPPSPPQTDPVGVTVEWLPSAGLPGVPEVPPSPCGAFYEVSIATTGSLAELKQFWERADFHPTSTEAHYTTLEDGLARISVYERQTCPHLFESPALTYFEKDMAQRIELLRSRGVTFAQELAGKNGTTDHAILISPEGLMLFLFSY